MEIIRKDNLFYIGDEEKPEAYLRISDEKDGHISIMSTFVDPKLRGEGVASKLTKEVIEYARENELKIIPVCSYAVTYFERHPEHEDLLGN